VRKKTELLQVLSRKIGEKCQQEQVIVTPCKAISYLGNDREVKKTVGKVNYVFSPIGMFLSVFRDGGYQGQLLQVMCKMINKKVERDKEVINSIKGSKNFCDISVDDIELFKGKEIYGTLKEGKLKALTDGVLDDDSLFELTEYLSGDKSFIARLKDAILEWQSGQELTPKILKSAITSNFQNYCDAEELNENQEKIDQIISYACHSHNLSSKMFDLLKDKATKIVHDLPPRDVRDAVDASIGRFSVAARAA